MPTLAETIRETTREHLLGDGLLFSQCVTAVGWIGNTVPEMSQGIVELPTSDVSNSGIVVGAGLAGRRPIYVIRYQGFMWYNAASLLNYAAKSKSMWGVPCPVFVRSLCMEGGIGPVASGSQHGMVMHMPGMPVVAPLTPGEWKSAWDFFLTHDDPVYCSEHRKSFAIDYEINDAIRNEQEVTIFAVSIARLAAIRAAEELSSEGVKCSVINLVWLKPCEWKGLPSLAASKFGLVVDCSHSICGASQSIAYELMHKTGKPVYALGLEDKTAGFAKQCDNITPDVNKIKRFVKHGL